MRFPAFWQVELNNDDNDHVDETALTRKYPLMTTIVRQ